MEVPEFCKQPAARLTRKKKTEEDNDPDYQPEVPSTSAAAASFIISSNSNSRNNDERKKVRRSVTLERNRRLPPPELQFIQRAPYSVENWKEKALEVRKARVKKVLNQMADDLKDVDQKQLCTIDYPVVAKLAQFASEDPYRRLTERGSNDEDKVDKNLDFNNLPPYVMGTGRGTEGGPQEFEFKSLWQYELMPLTQEDSCEDIIANLPWNKRDVVDPGVFPDILSIVACFSVGRELDLKTIADNTRNVEYNPDRFAPLVMRIRDPRSTALIFRTGRIIVTGTRSDEDCRKAVRKYARIIEKLGYRVGVLNFDIQNISASCNLKFRVRLNQLSHNTMFGQLSYEPELFPGLVIPLEHPRVKVIIFCTGSVLMTGAKSYEDLQTALNMIYSLVRMYAP